MLTSNLMAWQLQLLYASADYHPVGSSSATPGGNFSADGEGLKNALQAFNMNLLVTDSTGATVAWDPSGSASGPYVDFRLNGGHDFWAVLHDQVLTHARLLHGIL